RRALDFARSCRLRLPDSMPLFGSGLRPRVSRSSLLQAIVAPPHAMIPQQGRLSLVSVWTARHPRHITWRSGALNLMKAGRLRFIGIPVITFRIAHPQRHTFLKLPGTKADPAAYGAAVAALAPSMLRRPGRPALVSRSLIREQRTN